ncbi:cAMP-mediated signaling protein Sok1 [Ophiocordyceps camponoti-floridani]|uniref:cAMP-mediated signaling protein Sok1 n=1 Tax=Ophiocordyceps camponoti-floridani TaxID=2030778 RepID=A0A8H4VET7_9HYPO|nr:cAMP-mediated signaling protein Sok1 [Ophiocordyceps camponoti-floridani]
MEQGFGRGPVERSRRSLSTSAPVPPSEGESINDTDVQMQQPPQTDAESKAISPSSQESPRRCEAAVRAPSPGSAAMSRSTSSSTHAGTPSLDACASRKSSRLTPPQPGPVEPPVTRSTLSELDVSKIIHNPKLRHDINFDPELHFRPNLDGEKGRKKQDRANLFWRSLKEELTAFLTNRSAFVDKHAQNNDWTLPALLKAVKEIIQTLVPQRDRQFLDEGLNVDLLMQQFYRGIADLEKLALWLSHVLKSHCAPMRDDWVDTMYAQLSSGNRNSDLDELVTGMRSLLSVLEAMKLDVANHQIRCLRPVLIEDTTHFEQKFFLRKMESKKVDTSGARRWYADADRRFAPTSAVSSQTFGDMAVFFEALSRLVLPSTAAKRVPSTFLFDEERIMKLRSDVLDAVNLEVCMRMYEDLERVGRFSSSVLGATRALDDDTLNRSASPSLDFNFNTPPSRPSSLALSSAGSPASSPRASLVMPSYVAPESGEDRAKSRTVHGTLVALLQSATPTSRPFARWQELAPAMALQIFRYTSAPPEMLAAFESKLAENVCNANSQLYLEVEQAFHARLMTELGARVREFKQLSGVSLFAMATGVRAQSGAGPTRDRDSEGRESLDEGGIDDMATRLAHLGILHWRVWAQLAYLNDVADEMSVDSNEI